MANVVDRPERRLHDRPAYQCAAFIEPERDILWIIQRPGTESIGKINDMKIIHWSLLGQSNPPRLVRLP